MPECEPACTRVRVYACVNASSGVGAYVLCVHAPVCDLVYVCVCACVCSGCRGAFMHVGARLCARSCADALAHACVSV